MLRYLICQVLEREFDTDNPWLAAADGFCDAMVLFLMLG